MLICHILSWLKVLIAYLADDSVQGRVSGDGHIFFIYIIFSGVVAGASFLLPT